MNLRAGIDRRGAHGLCIGGIDAILVIEHGQDEIIADWENGRALVARVKTASFDFSE